MTDTAPAFTHGFLPNEEPIKQLPSSFDAWEHTAKLLPKYLLSDTFRAHIDAMPVFPIHQLESRAQQERAMMILSFIGHAYVLGAMPIVDKIPAVLAKPWCELAALLDRPPVLSYASYALHNWFKLDASKPIALGNIALLQNFLGGIDEEWFVLVHIDIEEKAGQTLQALAPLQKAAQALHIDDMVGYLKQIVSSMEAICDSFDRMPEHCDPYMYYSRVRPYIHGWKNNPSMPNGLIYEDCFNNEPQFFRGETGAQSSIVPALDAVFGIQHQHDDLSRYLQEMRTYMPKEHRLFLSGLEAQPNIRDCVVAHSAKNNTLRELYNQCIDLIVRFRSTHLKYAALYIQKQSQQSDANSTSVGTGGTPFMKYLSKHEQESEHYKIEA